MIKIVASAALALALGASCNGGPEATGVGRMPSPERAAGDEEAAPRAEAVREGDRVRYVLPYPTGERESSVLLVEKIVPAQVRAGEPYEYIIRVTNLTETPVSEVVVSEAYEGAELQVRAAEQPDRAERAAKARGEKRAPQDMQAEQQAAEPGRWTFGTLAPGATEEVVVQAVAQQTGEIQTCLAADYEPALCTAVDVVNPELAITKRGPDRAYLCEQVTYTYAVTNTGSGTARNVRILESLPDGLTTEQGETELAIEVGDLEAGQTEEFTVELEPTATGTFESQAIARSATDEVVSQPVTTSIVQPRLAVDVIGPEWQYAGEPVTYTVEVTNTSNVPARDTVLELEAANAPEEVEDREIGTLAPGQTERVSVTLEAEDDALSLAAAARSICAQPATARIATAVRRVPALLLETVDLEDPVRVGDTTTYEVTVLNQGEAPAQNVNVRAELPPNMTLVDAEGPTDVSERDGALQLGPISELPPGEEATWEIEVRAEEPGNVRFRTELDSELLRQPVPDVEPTHVIEPQ